MEEELSKYELYILKEIEGELSPVEKIELEQWIENPENKKIYDEQKKLIHSVGLYNKMQSVNKKKAFKKIENQIFGSRLQQLTHKFEKVAAILFVPLVLSLAWLYFNENSESEESNNIVYNTVEVPLGVRSSLTLPDGTIVWLNAGSRLKYPVVFAKDERKVELVGEAYFDVSKNKKRPFYVSAGDIYIKVLGTSFNCCAYPEEGKIEAALEEGSIHISSKNNENSFVMTPGELATFRKSENKVNIVTTNLDKYVAWKSGRLLFRDDPMNRVLEKLGRWYNVEFHVKDQEILGYVYSATFTGESLDQMLKMFALSAPIDYKILKREKRVDNSYEKQIVELKKKEI